MNRQLKIQLSYSFFVLLQIFIENIFLLYIFFYILYILFYIYYTGLMEFVPSHTFTSVHEKFNENLGAFFQHYNPKPSDLQVCLDNYIRSCAGYIIIHFVYYYTFCLLLYIR
jgi:hypothetical protein